MEFYVFADREKWGPYSEEKLKEYFDAGTFPREIPIWAEGFPNWIPYNQWLFQKMQREIEEREAGRIANLEKQQQAKKPSAFWGILNRPPPKLKAKDIPGLLFGIVVVTIIIFAPDYFKNNPDLAEHLGNITVPILLICGIVFIYFLPSIVGRNKKNAGAIFVLNLFLGWSGIAWVIALVWAVTKDD